MHAFELARLLCRRRAFARATKDQGAGIVDVVVAMFLLYVVVTASLALLRGGSVALGATQSRSFDAAELNRVMAIAAGQGCGAEPLVNSEGDAAASIIGSRSESSIDSDCSVPFGGETVQGDPLPWGTTIHDTKDTVTLRSWFVPSSSLTGADDDICSAPLQSPEPMGIARESWIEGKQTNLTETGFSVLPPSSVVYHSNQDDGLVVFAGIPSPTASDPPAADLITVQLLTDPTGSYASVERYVTVGGCAWFPFVPAGDAAAAFSGVSVTVNAASPVPGQVGAVLDTTTLPMSSFATPGENVCFAASDADEPGASGCTRL